MKDLNFLTTNRNTKDEESFVFICAKNFYLLTDYSRNLLLKIIRMLDRQHFSDI